MGTCWTSNRNDTEQGGINVTTERWSLRLVHEGQARTLSMQPSSTVSELKKFAHETWGISMDRVELVFQKKHISAADGVEITSLGISTGAVIEARITPPKVPVKATAAGPRERIQQCAEEAAPVQARIAVCLEQCESGPLQAKQAKQVMHQCDMCNELLTQTILKMDGCLDGAELSEDEAAELRCTRKALLTRIQETQDKQVARVRQLCTGAMAVQQG
eukprot:TRINITY_DN23426_c0_g1_i1.p2 TRINITY_DN23426_c0_g1~~TRINITY_DN23426_c0_g1_i1.p2  ORF type:complete len:218 (+),score=74.07 TRINITY_DN23426_c0_g1_i1:217-870(+)